MAQRIVQVKCAYFDFTYYIMCIFLSVFKKALAIAPAVLQYLWSGYWYLHCPEFPFSIPSIEFPCSLPSSPRPIRTMNYVDTLISWLRTIVWKCRGITGGRITPCLFCTGVCERVLFNCLSLHPPSNRYCFLLKDTKKHTQTSVRIINTSQMTAGIDCLLSTIMFLLFTF